MLHREWCDSSCQPFKERRRAQDRCISQPFSPKLQLLGQMCFLATGKQQETWLILNSAVQTRSCNIYRKKRLTCKVSKHSFPSTSSVHEIETEVLKCPSLSLTLTPDTLNRYQPPWILMYISVKLFTGCVLCFNPWGNSIYCRCQKQRRCCYSTQQSMTIGSVLCWGTRTRARRCEQIWQSRANRTCEEKFHPEGSSRTGPWLREG